MPDFSKLTSRPAGEAPKPKALPVGNAPGIIKSFELLPAPPGKDYESIVRFQLGLMDWPDTAGEDDKTHDGRPVDITKKQLRKDFYDTSLHRLDDLIKSCGVDPKGRTYAEVLPELVGCRVVIGIGQYLNQSTNEVGNQVNTLVGEK